MAKRGISVETERIVRVRARGLCEYCCCPEEFSPDTFSLEHIVPRALGGEGSSGNLALACQGCNGFKATHTQAFDLVSSAFAPIFNPRTHIWDEHFRWSVEPTLVEGISAIGRVTVEMLRMNRLGVVNLRRLLILDERHPPE
jgi:hypothetical protein